MSNPIVILHGWSDDSASFKNLKSKLMEWYDRPVDEVKLVDWLSMDDEVSYDDISAALDDEWTRKGLSRVPHSVDFVVHSTGALVLRHWLVKYFGSPSACPAMRILMLAPANYGSYLADEGKSFMGRIIKGGFSDTGKKLLDGLELASGFTQDLAHRDVFENWFKPANGIYVTVLIGDGSFGGLSGMTHEDGSDNTIMIPCANLDCLEVDYTIAQTPAEIKRKGYKTKASFKSRKHSCDTTFCVMKDYHHGDVTGRDGFTKMLTSLVRRSLTVTKKHWAQHQSEATEVSNLGANPYANLVLSVTDQLGQPVEKYLMLMSVRHPEKVWQTYKAKGIEDVHRNKTDASRRAFYVNTKELFESLKMGTANERDLIIKIVADPCCEYGKSKKPMAGFLSEQESPEMIISPETLSKVIRPGYTTFLNVQIPRLFDRVSKVEV